MALRDHLIATAAVAALLAGCASEPAPAPEPETDAAEAGMPAMVMAARGGFIPEGVEYDANGSRFLTGSIAEGTIFQIGFDGAVTPFITDEELVSSVGIEADEERDRLLVANADAAVFDGSSAGQAKLGIYRLSTGERLAMVDLAATMENAPADAAHFANDVAVGADGTAYVTDTRANALYAVTADGGASLLRTFDDFSPNGIVYHPDGYLLVVGGTAIWKVPVADPAAATAVALPEEIPGQDGAVLLDDGRLAVVSNSGNRVVALASADGWASAQVTASAAYETQATTVAVAGGDLYVVHPHFADADPPSLERVTLQ